MDWFLFALRQYAVFSGRARRREYWFFMAFYVGISAFLSVLDAIAGHPGTRGHGASAMGPLSTVFALAMLLPALGVAVRRLHDTGRSGWWLLLGAVPLLGTLVLLVFAMSRGTPGPNAYGPQPPGQP